MPSLPSPPPESGMRGVVRTCGKLTQRVLNTRLVTQLRPLMHLYDLVRCQPMCLAVHPIHRHFARPLCQAEDGAILLVGPVAPVGDPVPLLRLQILSSVVVGAQRADAEARN